MHSLFSEYDKEMGLESHLMKFVTCKSFINSLVGEARCEWRFSAGFTKACKTGS